MFVLDRLFPLLSHCILEMAHICTSLIVKLMSLLLRGVFVGGNSLALLLVLTLLVALPSSSFIFLRDDRVAVVEFLADVVPRVHVARVICISEIHVGVRVGFSTDLRTKGMASALSVCTFIAALPSCLELTVLATITTSLTLTQRAFLVFLRLAIVVN